MTAHIAVPALDDPALPATLSPKILTGVLRDELGFKGIIVTDALDMGGIAHGFTVGDASVRALEAGADVLLMPSDPEAAIDAVVAAVRSRPHLDRSASTTERHADPRPPRRAWVWRRKSWWISKKSIRWSIRPRVTPSRSAIADRSVTLVQKHRPTVPLTTRPPPVSSCWWKGAASVEGQAFATELRKRRAHGNVMILDSTTSDADLQAALQKASQANEYVVAAFVSVAAYRGNVALARRLPAVAAEPDRYEGKPVTLLSLGNPYLLRNFPQVAAYIATYSTVPVSETAAVKALFGETAISGKLPVSIPGFANYPTTASRSNPPARRSRPAERSS